MPILERAENPWEEVLLLNPSRKGRKGGRKVAKKRGRKGRKSHRGAAGRKLRIPVTVQGGGLLSVGRKRRIGGIKVVGKSAMRRVGRGRKTRRSRKGMLRGAAWQRAHRKTLRKTASRLARAGKLKTRSVKPAGFEYLDNPRGGSRMARRRSKSRRSRRRSRKDNAWFGQRKRHSRAARKGRSSRRRHRRSRRSRRSSRRARMDNPRRRVRRHRVRRSVRRHRRARYDNPKRGKRRHRKARTFSLLAVRRSNPLSAIKSFPFKEAAINGGIAGLGLVATNFLFGSKSPLPDSIKQYGNPATVTGVAVRNGTLLALGVLTYSFTRFKPAGVAMATVAVANAVNSLATSQLGTTLGLGDLGLTAQTFEALPMGTAEQPTGLFHGLSSDLVYGSAMPYGSGLSGLESNLVLQSAAPYGTGMEGFNGFADAVSDEEAVAELV